MTKFQCAACGEWHEDTEGEWGFRAPGPWLSLSEQERSEQGRYTPDACVIYGKAFFVRGCAYIPVVGRESAFAWGLWVGVTEGNYRRIAALQDVEGRENEPSFAARIVNGLAVTIYPSTFNLKCRLQLLRLGLRPAIIVEPSEHPLGLEQRDGISIERLREIVHLMATVS